MRVSDRVTEVIVIHSHITPLVQCRQMCASSIAACDTFQPFSLWADRYINYYAILQWNGSMLSHLVLRPSGEQLRNKRAIVFAVMQATTTPYSQIDLRSVLV